MSLKPDTLGMTIMLAFMTALGPLATDMYLPSLPSIGHALAASDAQVQTTLSAYLVGFALGQIVYGPIADKLGRKPVLIAGFLLFIAGSFACALAGSIGWLVAARVLQAFGAAGPITLARAIVRDLYHGPRAGRELSRMGAIMGVTPAIAPMFGGVLQQLFGWQSNFYAAGLGAIAVAICAMLFLPETLRAKQAAPLSPRAIVRTFGMLLGHRAYRVNVAILTLAYAGLFAYLSAVSFLLQGVYGFGEVAFGAVFGLGALAYVTGTVIASKIVRRRGIDGTIAIGVACLFVGGVTQLVAMAVLPDRSTGLIVPMLLYLAGIGLTLPQTIAASMEPFPDHAGAASSLAGLIQMSVSALAGIAVGQALTITPLALPLATAFSGTVCFVLFNLTRHWRPAT
ncbi:multidrug effflux MFS transporter [Lichenihabitans psoromatis]|uniref:multidrug effflux MFS transporter n=1 Tax=Lichenihabitans psoromatis TaxID=2528642 RepID=UPI0010384D06|nr:multidrug effflux MFS transporter [Lichenihabitans psoromatis]